MSRRDPTEALLAELRAERAEPDPVRAAELIRRCLAARSCLAAARAAELAGSLGLAGLAEELASALRRLLGEPYQADPGCRAKTALARALIELEEAPAELLRRGARHVQWEPVFGGREDSAPELRGTCLLGLATGGDPDADLLLADGLADPERGVRISAARGVAERGLRSGAAVLRLKLRLGDPDPLVVVELLRGLLALEPEGGLELARELLDDPETAEAAALALGESRRPEAFGLLRTRWQDAVAPEARRVALRALALLRSEEALGLLLEILAEGRRRDALEALEALEPYRGEARIRDGIRRAAAERTDLDVQEES